MASTAVSQLGETRECFDCEGGTPSGQHNPSRNTSSQQKKRAMHVTMAFVLGYLIGVMDFGSLLEGLGLEPATQQHGVVPANVISLDLDCISSRRKAKYESFKECEVTKHGNKSPSSQAPDRENEDWVFSSMANFAHAPLPKVSHPVPAAFSSNARSHDVAGPSMSAVAVTDGIDKTVGDGGVMAMPPGAVASSVTDAKVGEPAVATKKNPLRTMFSGAVAAALLTPTASLAAKTVETVGKVVDHSKDGIHIFNNMRTPAALVAGACLNLAFALPKPDNKEPRRLRLFKRLNVLLGFASITSQLVCVIFATNAINRLTEHAGTIETMAATLGELLTKDLFVQFWLGTYIHFIIGILGMLGMVAMRAWFFMGESYARPIGAMTTAVALRLLSAINRGVVVTEFGGGPGGSNFLYLAFHYIGVTIRSAWAHRRLADLMSLGFAAGAIGLFGKILLTRGGLPDDEDEAEECRMW